MRLDGRLCASTIAITAALAAIAGCGGNSGNGATSSGATATSTPVAVVRCPTTFGADGQHVPPTPATMPASLAPGVAKGLSFYVGGLTVLAPTGWKCSSSVGADGGSGITVYPPGDSEQSPSQGVEVSEIPACQGCMADLACPFFANAEAQLGYDTPCSGSIPASEGIKRPSRNVVEFFDPPHVKGNGLGSGGAYTARGTVILLPSTAKFADSATMIACTLPAATAADCAPIIDQYVGVVKRQSGPQFTAVWPKITTPTTSTPPPSAAASQPGYLAYASNGVLFIQWTRVGNNVTGTLSESYSDPSNAANVSHESDSFTGVISGSSVTLTLDNDTNWNGTLTGSGVTLSYTGSDGTLHTFPFAKGTVGEYNTAVQGVTAQGNAAQQAQAQQQATTSAEQQLDSDASTLSTGISNLQTASSQLTTDLGKVPADLTTTRTDLATQKSDLAHLLATRAATCSSDSGYQVANADTYTVVNADTYQVDNADEYTVSNDQQAIATGISTLRSDAQKKASDQAALPRYFATGMPTNGEIQGAISSATSAASVGKSKWATDLATVKQLDAVSNGYASQANKACGNG